MLAQALPGAEGLSGPLRHGSKALGYHQGARMVSRPTAREPEVLAVPGFGRGSAAHRLV